MKRIVSFFLNAYSEDAEDIQLKTRWLLLVNIGLQFAGVGIIVLNLVEGANHFSIGSVVIAMLFFCLALVLLKTGRYPAAAAIVSTTAILFVTVLMYSIGKTHHYLEMAQLGFLLVAAMMLVNLVNRYRKTASLYTILAVVCLYGYYGVKVALDLMPVEWLYFRALIESTMIMGMILVLVYLTQGLLDKQMARIQDESKDRELRNEEAREAIDSASESLNIGTRLTDISDKALADGQDVEKSITEIRHAMSDLAREASSSSNRNNQVASLVETVNEEVREHDVALTEFSATLNQMNSSTTSMARFATEKRTSVENLMETARDGGKEINGALAAIDVVDMNSTSVLDIINVISGIGEQTQILAMNAAIQAAHAGEAGKGFSVVAGEIRSLAYKTQNNIKTISETLETNVENIQTAVMRNHTAADSFKDILSDIGEVSNAVEEIITGLTELSRGSDELLSGIAEIGQTSRIIRESSENVGESIGLSSTSLEAVDMRSKSVTDEVAVITDRIVGIVDVIRNIHQLGETSVDQMHTLSTKLGSLA